MQHEGNPRDRRIFSLTAILGTVIVGLVLLTSIAAMGNEKTVRVTMQENGNSVSLQKGDLLEVTLPASLGTGFSWHLHEDPQLPLSMKGKPETKKSDSDKSQVGSTEYQVFRFEAKAAGSGKLKLDYLRAWEKQTPPANTYSLTVNVH